MKYRVRKLNASPTIDASWDKQPWNDIPPMIIGRHMGEKPVHMPLTKAKIAYDDASLYLIFRVEDRFVRAVARQYHDHVCRDSCVEFFFTPGTDLSLGYFNVEINCGGILLFHFQDAPGKNSRPLSDSECAQVQIAHSLPSIIEPEIAEPTVWTIEYRLPVALLRKYCAFETPAPGVKWRANFYKCADKTSHPHWLTWAPVNQPGPNFHVPEDFGVLIFEDSSSRL